jgi:hypothetical protein
LYEFLTKLHPFTSHTYERPLDRSRSNPQTACPNMVQTSCAMVFSSGLSNTGKRTWQQDNFRRSGRGRSQACSEVGHFHSASCASSREEDLEAGAAQQIEEILVQRVTRFLMFIVPLRAHASTWSLGKKRVFSVGARVAETKVLMSNSSQPTNMELGARLQP